jgi:hypothetical protein
VIDSYVAPRLTTTAGDVDVVDSEWGFAALVAAVLGIAVGTVIAICAICGARSFSSCLQAVKDWFNGGC